MRAMHHDCAWNGRLCRLHRATLTVFDLLHRTEETFGQRASVPPLHCCLPLCFEGGSRACLRDVRQFKQLQEGTASPLGTHVRLAKCFCWDLRPTGQPRRGGVSFSLSAATTTTCWCGPAATAQVVAGLAARWPCSQCTTPPRCGGHDEQLASSRRQASGVLMAGHQRALHCCGRRRGLEACIELHKSHLRFIFLAGRHDESPFGWRFGMMSRRGEPTLVCLRCMAEAPGAGFSWAPNDPAVMPSAALWLAELGMHIRAQGPLKTPNPMCP